jgi:hypothetical protein
VENVCKHKDLSIIPFKVLFVIKEHREEDLVVLFSCSAVLKQDFEVSLFIAVTSCELSLVTSISITNSSVINCTFVV